MALEDIFRALEEQADEECEQILSTARDHAEAIEEDAHEQAEQVRATRIADAERATRSRAARSTNAARLESKKRVAAVKEAAVRRVFDAALESLSTVRSDTTYPAAFKAFMQEALEGVDGAMEVHVDPADQSLAERTLQELGAAAGVVADLTTTGGMVVVTGGGRILRRNLLEDRLDKVTPFIESDVAEILFS